MLNYIKFKFKWMLLLASVGTCICSKSFAAKISDEEYIRLAPKEVLNTVFKKYVSKKDKKIAKDAPFTKDLGDGYKCSYEPLPKHMLKIGKSGFAHIENVGKAKRVVTMHGILTIDHPLICEILDSPIFNRLKKISQYGICEHIEKTLSVPNPEVGYTRFQHSLGDMVMIAKYFNQSGKVLLTAMISGLTHDISHTPFSHSLDLAFMGEFENAYHDRTLPDFMERHGLGEILEKYNLTIEEIMPEKHIIQDVGEMYADRIEYNLYAALKESHYSVDDLKLIYAHLHFDNDCWYFDNIEAALRFALLPIWNSKFRWGWVDSYVTSELLKYAVFILLNDEVISPEDIDYKLGDEEMWDILSKSKDARIIKLVDQIRFPNKYFKVVPVSTFKDDGYHLKGKSKLRVINPLVLLNGKLQPLDQVCPEFKTYYEDQKKSISDGFCIKSKKEKTFMPHDNVSAAKMDRYKVFCCSYVLYK